MATLSVAELTKRLEALEAAHKKMAILALATDRDLQREKCRHELIVHLRGSMLAEVQTMFESHKANTGSDKRARTVEDQNDDAAMAAQRASLRNTQAAASWKVKLWQWLLQVLKSRAGDAEEAGRSRMAVAAVTKIHAMEGSQVVHMMRFHTPEPVEEVWRFSLDFTFSAVGAEACQYFQWDLQPFSFGELSFHKANPRPGRAAQAVAEAATCTTSWVCQRPWTWTWARFFMMVLCDQSTLGSISHNMAKSTLCYLFSSLGFCKSRLDILLFGVGCPLTSGLSVFPLHSETFSYIHW